MSIITLLTDFGLQDEFVGSMKGVILSINPHVKIVDISHQIDPHDIVQAAFCLQAFYTYFPAGTVHITVVDPGVGTKRAIVILQRNAHVFVAPDNGVLSLLVNDDNYDTIVRVDNSDYFLDAISATFHGRDMMAPVGAYLSKGARLETFGSSLNHHQLVCLDDLLTIEFDGSELVSKVVNIDRFGNLVTNLNARRLKQFQTGCRDDELIFRVGSELLRGLQPTYASVSSGEPLALIGSRGYLEIAVNQGNASNRFSVQKGDRIRVAKAAGG